MRSLLLPAQDSSLYLVTHTTEAGMLWFVFSVSSTGVHFHTFDLGLKPLERSVFLDTDFKLPTLCGQIDLDKRLRQTIEAFEILPHSPAICCCAICPTTRPPQLMMGHARSPYLHCSASMVHSGCSQPYPKCRHSHVIPFSFPHQDFWKVL